MDARSRNRAGCRAFALALLASSASLCAWQPANAQDVASDLAELKAALARQQAQIEAQQHTIEQQQNQLKSLEQLLTDPAMAGYRGMGIVGAPPVQTASQQPPANGQDMPETPVGEAQEVEPDTRIQAAAVPQEQGVLTPGGTFVIEPSFDYNQSSTDRLVFRGFELIPGIQVGVIEASKARRDTLVDTIALRYGVTPRLEVEARFPFIHRYDRIEVAQQRDEGIVRSISLEGNHIGDIEMAVRYQFNRQKGQNPIFVGSLRVKSDTGRGPFDISYDEFGVASGLSTGSGFWGVQPGINMLLPSDPVVIFGGVSYLWHLPRNIDKNIGGALIGRVDPGDAISANLGFGFALNPRFSYSLGYRHSYIFKTTTEIGDVVEKSKPLQVGSLALGMSYRLDERSSLNFSFEFGVTEDAPDVGITLRVPFSF